MSYVSNIPETSMAYSRPNGGITKFAAVDFSGNRKRSLLNVKACQPAYKGATARHRFYCVWF